MSYKRIQIATARPQIEQKTATVIDIRDPQSYESGHICNAVHISNDNIQEFMQTTSKDTPIIVCCYHGNSSQSAAQFLVDQGFQDVASLDGGFEMWKLGAADLCSAE
ncbi:MAG: thiosulfate sulfurtransferase GlpE [Oleibacter sp.]|nr:thiosulfate sulfurtransferase GlpE [Thalassolituus sp.]